MNKDNAAQFLPLVQALAEGKVIQELSGNTWKDIEATAFNRDPAFYRIKPEPRRIWVNEYELDATVFESKEHATSAAHQSARRIAIEYREVIE